MRQSEVVSVSLKRKSFWPEGSSFGRGESLQIFINLDCWQLTSVAGRAGTAAAAGDVFSSHLISFLG